LAGWATLLAAVFWKHRLDRYEFENRTEGGVVQFSSYGAAWFPSVQRKLSVVLGVIATLAAVGGLELVVLAFGARPWPRSMRYALTILAATCALAGCRGHAPEIHGAVVAGSHLTGLPLKRGFYVANGTACAAASNATLLLVHRDGIRGSRDACTFGTIERTGPTSYRVTEQCADIQAGPDSAGTARVGWEIPDDASFRSTSDAGWQRHARYCEQSSLPDPWRDSDISDLVDEPLEEALGRTDLAWLRDR
jgi:hypothetical protein